MFPGLSDFLFPFGLATYGGKSRGASLPRLKMTSSPCHYAFERLEFGDWFVKSDAGDPGPYGLPKFENKKLPAFAAKLIFSAGGKLVFEFDYECRLGNRAKIEVKQEHIVAVKQDGESLLFEFSRPVSTNCGSQATEGGYFGAAKRTRTTYDNQSTDDFSAGEVPRCRYCKVVFNAASRCSKFADRVKELDSRFSGLLATGLEVDPARKYFTTEEIAAAAAAGKGSKKKAGGKENGASAGQAASGNAKKAKTTGTTASANNPRESTKEQKEAAAARGWLGSNGSSCDGCNNEEMGDDYDVCPRCLYTACEDCQCHHSRGTCHCKDSNMGDAYPKRREWFMSGNW